MTLPAGCSSNCGGMTVAAPISDDRGFILAGPATATAQRHRESPRIQQTASWMLQYDDLPRADGMSCRRMYRPPSPRHIEVTVVPAWPASKHINDVNAAVARPELPGHSFLRSLKEHSTQTVARDSSTLGPSVWCLRYHSIQVTQGPMFLKPCERRGQHGGN